MGREWGAGPRQLPVRACLLVVSGGEQQELTEKLTNKRVMRDA